MYVLQRASFYIFYGRQSLFFCIFIYLFIICLMILFWEMGIKPSITVKNFNNYSLLFWLLVLFIFWGYKLGMYELIIVMSS